MGEYIGTPDPLREARVRLQVHLLIDACVAQRKTKSDAIVYAGLRAISRLTPGAARCRGCDEAATARDPYVQRRVRTDAPDGIHAAVLDSALANR